MFQLILATFRQKIPSLKYELKNGPIKLLKTPVYLPSEPTSVDISASGVTKRISL